MSEESLSEYIPQPQTAQEDGSTEGNETMRELQLTLSKRKKQCIKLKRKIHNCQAKLEKQDERLKSIQEKIVEAQMSRKDTSFNWASVKAAHLISKVFENCEPVRTKKPENDNGDGSLVPTSTQNSANNLKYLHDDFEADNTSQITIEGSPFNTKEPSKRKYTIDLHRFAIALYFFSPTTYFYLSKLLPIFPHQNYIRQWVTAGRVEKLFPPGVYRDDFDES